MSFPPRREPSPEPTHCPRTPPEGGAGGCLPRGSGAPTPPRANLALPASLVALLAEFRSCFSSRTFPVFCALAAGLLAQTARRTVCGMLVGAGLSRVWPLDQVCATLTRLVVRLLLPEGQPVRVAVDDTLFHRRGPKVHAASWFHDGSAQGARKVGYGNNWVIAAIVARLRFLDRPVALPVGFALVAKGTDAGSRLEPSRRLVESLAAAVPDRRVHVVADCAYAGQALRGLDPRISWTTRLRSNAALYRPAPPRTGRRGRPRLKGARLGSLATPASQARSTPTTVSRYQTTSTVQTAVVACLWYGVFGAQPVQVVFLRDRARTGYDIALVTTDPTATAARVIQRYAVRWSIEVAIEDAKQTFGVGQARNRLRAAVERTTPFGLVVSSLAVCWCATAGHTQTTSRPPASSPPGTAPRPSHRSRTCSPSYDASSSPHNFAEQTPNPSPHKKSPSCAWPGRTSLRTRKSSANWHQSTAWQRVMAAPQPRLESAWNLMAAPAGRASPAARATRRVLRRQ